MWQTSQVYSRVGQTDGQRDPRTDPSVSGLTALWTDGWMDRRTKEMKKGSPRLTALRVRKASGSDGLGLWGTELQREGEMNPLCHDGIAAALGRGTERRF